MIGIYAIKNTINNKVYIGQSINIGLRFKRHIYKLEQDKHPNIYLQREWNKYGSDKFNFSVLEICDKDQIYIKEMKYIKLFNSNINKFGYNLTEGGEGSLGYKHSEDTKLKMKRSGKIKIFTKMHRQHLSEASKNRPPVSSETKEKIRNNKLGKKRDNFSEEWKNKISLSLKGNQHTKGKKQSEYTKKKKSESLKKLNKNQELEIKQLLLEGLSPYDIAPRYNVSVSPIYRILKEMKEG